MESEPDTYKPQLALALTVLGARLVALTQPREGLEVANEAVAIYRELTAAKTDMFNRDFAVSLHGLSECLAWLNEMEKALVTMQHAVEVYRKLAEINPKAFIPELARGLNDLSNRFINLDRPEDARQAVEEAIALRRKLVAEDPEAHGTWLASSLNNLGVFLSMLGLEEEALAASTESVQLRRNGRSDPKLADSLINHSGMLSHLGRIDEALDAIQEAVVIHRMQYAYGGTSFARELAKCLLIAGQMYKSQDPKTATYLFLEGLSTLLHFATENPGVELDFILPIKEEFEASCRNIGMKPEQVIESQQRLIREGKLDHWSTTSAEDIKDRWGAGAS